HSRARSSVLRSDSAPLAPSAIGDWSSTESRGTEAIGPADLLADDRRSPVVSALPSTLQSMLVNELTDGVEIDQVLLVRQAERRRRRDGGDYLRLQLGDRTGSLACMVWEELGEVERVATAGAPIRVRGRYTVHPRFGPQVNLHGLEAADPGTFSLDDLIDGPLRGVEQMEREVRELIGTVQEPHLRLLLERVFGEGSELW